MVCYSRDWATADGAWLSVVFRSMAERAQHEAEFATLAKLGAPLEAFVAAAQEVYGGGPVWVYKPPCASGPIWLLSPCEVLGVEPDGEAAKVYPWFFTPAVDFVRVYDGDAATT